MANPFLDAWESIKLQDGTPDHCGRRKALDDLISSFPPDERSRLRLRLNAEPHIQDPCNRLKDILWHLVGYLDPEDLVSASQASKTWRATWTSSVLTIRILEQHFYDKYRSYQSLEEDLKESQKEWLTQWLPVALRDRVARKQLRHHSKWTRHVEFNPIPRPDGEFVHISPTHYRQYCNGRVALTPTLEYFKVTSLFTQKTKVYTSKDREQIGAEWILGDEFLIAMYPRNMLIAWSLEKDEVFEIRLPRVRVSLSLYKDRVAVEFEDEFIIWQIGKSARSFKYPTSIDEGQTKKILLDPYDEERVYLVCIWPCEELSASPSAGSPIPPKLVEVKMFEWHQNQFKGEVFRSGKIDPTATLDVKTSLSILNTSFSQTTGLYTIYNELETGEINYPEYPVVALLDIDLTSKYPTISLNNIELFYGDTVSPCMWHGQHLVLRKIPESGSGDWHLVARYKCGYFVGTEEPTPAYADPMDGDVIRDDEEYSCWIAGDDDFVVVFGIAHYEVRCFLSPSEFKRRRELCEQQLRLMSEEEN